MGTSIRDIRHLLTAGVAGYLLHRFDIQKRCGCFENILWKIVVPLLPVPNMIIGWLSRIGGIMSVSIIAYNDSVVVSCVSQYCPLNILTTFDEVKNFNNIFFQRMLPHCVLIRFFSHAF